ncbi:hypothetical protein IFM46972_02714 [Aspergillus udagawae]|uniref:Uncharacterized protein n=1 Tax=Aspergillus udagawae TaxID=91492 RepID=A0A8H3NHE8_9EURO|nr:hypothetical protein IFM46972_02714 [Aspergillus udagawae]
MSFSFFLPSFNIPFSIWDTEQLTTTRPRDTYAAFPLRLNAFPSATKQCAAPKQICPQFRRQECFHNVI